MMLGHSKKVERKIAAQQCRSLKDECQSISTQIKIEIDQILTNSYKEMLSKVVEEYKSYLSELKLGVNTSALSFNPINLVSNSVADLFSIIEDNTTTVDEGKYVQKTKQVVVPSKRKWYNPLSWFEEGDHYEQEYYQEWESKNIEYVNMEEVAYDFIMPFQEELGRMESSAVEHIKQETNRLKVFLKDELLKIDDVLSKKLDKLQKTEADTQAKDAEIKQKEKDLKWLNSIQTRVNNIIHF